MPTFCNGPTPSSLQKNQFLFLNSVSLDIYEEIEQAFCSHPVLEKEIKDAVNGPAACKHLVQQVW